MSSAAPDTRTNEEKAEFQLGYLAFAISRHPRLIIMGTCLGLAICVVWHVFSPASYRSESLVSIGNSAAGIGVITNATRAEKRRLINEFMAPEVIELAAHKMGLIGDYDEIRDRYVHVIEFAFHTRRGTNHSMTIGVNHRTKQTLYQWSQHHVKAYLEVHDIPQYTATYMGLTMVRETSPPSRLFIVVGLLFSVTLGLLTPWTHVKLQKRLTQGQTVPNKKSIPNPSPDPS